jgi:hypothetical protein
MIKTRETSEKQINPEAIPLKGILVKNLNYSFHSLVLLIFIHLSLNLVAQDIKIEEKFDPKKTPSKPDYSLVSSWASLPFIKDAADTVAGKGKLRDEQENAPADVFFIHPTSFTRKPKGENLWNGAINDEELNRTTDEGSIRYQASVFNGAGKIYAPRYRQAHYYSYFTKDTATAKKAFEVAYEDVKSAFEYYLKNYNNGRPIIIASHSQGSNHAITLLQDFFDGKPLSNQLICAYIVGMPVYDTMFKNIKACENANQTGCYCSWRTFAVGYYPMDYTETAKLPVCTNPLTWSITNTYASSKLNKGGILREMDKIIPKLCDAQVGDGVLRINKPNFKGSKLINIKNYHIADYNLFYLNVRENTTNRTNLFLVNAKK